MGWFALHKTRLLRQVALHVQLYRKQQPLLRVTDTQKARLDRCSQDVGYDAGCSMIEKVRWRQCTKWGSHGCEVCASRNGCSAVSRPCSEAARRQQGIQP